MDILAPVPAAKDTIFWENNWIVAFCEEAVPMEISTPNIAHTVNIHYHSGIMGHSL